ncbi:MAG: AraC family transcriptional regulator ligand-binding domain-containing protein [Gammaproteobacteria bacterium]
METHIRAGSLENFAPLLQKLGHDPDEVLRASGLSISELADTEARVSYEHVLRAIEYPASELGILDFGLQLANEQTLEFLGPIFLAIQAAPNVHEALLITAEYIHFHTPGARIELEPDDDRKNERARLIIPIADRINSTQSIEHAVAHLAKVVSVVSQGTVLPESICFRHTALGELARYRTFLGQTPKFEQSFDGIRLDLSDSRQTVPQRNPLLLKTVQQYLDGVAPPRDLPIDQQLSEILPQLMRFRFVDASAAAAALRLNLRTMQRRLKARGTSFEVIRDATRKQLAREYLQETVVPLSQVAHMLGYSDHAVLHRSCKRWFDATPGELRKASSLR